MRVAVDLVIPLRIIVDARYRNGVGLEEDRHDEKVDHLGILIHFGFRRVAPGLEGLRRTGAVAKRIAHDDLFALALRNILGRRTHVKNAHVVKEVRVLKKLLKVGRIFVRKGVEAEKRRIKRIGRFRTPVGIVLVELFRHRVFGKDLL